MLEKAIEEFKGDFTAIPVKNIRYWKDAGLFLGEETKNNSTISFKYYNPIFSDYAIAYVKRQQKVTNTRGTKGIFW
jgi:hypothetical protein